MCLGGVKLPCTPLPSTCTMSCAWSIKTQCIALLAAFFALRGHYVYYASRENTTIVAMATFVQELLPRAPEKAWPIAIRLLSQPQLV